MQRRIITLTPDFPRIAAVNWDIDWREQSTGAAISGRRGISLSSLPRWVGTPSLWFYEEAIGKWRAHRLSARGMTGIFRLPMIDPAVYLHPDLDALPFSDGALFSDGTGFENEQAVLCPNGAAAGASEIVVDMDSTAGTIRQGQIMSHGDWPFAVTSISGNTLTIEMPLRRAIPANSLIKLRGRGLFEMVQARTGATGYDANHVAQTEFQLQEWLR